jgi:hypothetical protein
MGRGAIAPRSLSGMDLRNGEHFLDGGSLRMGGEVGRHEDPGVNRPSRVGLAVLLLLALLIVIVFFVHYTTVAFLLQSIWFYLFLVVIVAAILGTSLASTRST